MCDMCYAYATESEEEEVSGLPETVESLYITIRTLGLERDAIIMSLSVEREEKLFRDKLVNIGQERSKILTSLRIFPWYAVSRRARLARLEQEITRYQFKLAEINASDPYTMLTSAERLVEKCEQLIGNIKAMRKNWQKRKDNGRERNKISNML